MFIGGKFLQRVYELTDKIAFYLEGKKRSKADLFQDDVYVIQIMKFM